MNNPKYLTFQITKATGWHKGEKLFQVLLNMVANNNENKEYWMQNFIQISQIVRDIFSKPKNTKQFIITGDKRLFIIKLLIIYDKYEEQIKKSKIY